MGSSQSSCILKWPLLSNFTASAKKERFEIYTFDDFADFLLDPGVFASSNDLFLVEVMTNAPSVILSVTDDCCAALSSRRPTNASRNSSVHRKDDILVID